MSERTAWFLMLSGLVLMATALSVLAALSQDDVGAAWHWPPPVPW